MKYKIQNTSTTTTVWIDAYNQGNAFPLPPGKICSVPEHTKNQVIAGNPDILTVLGTVTDTNAPAYYSAIPGASWVLVTMGPGDKFYSNFKIFASAAGNQLSFSGWDTSAGETAPPTWSVIDIPVVANTLLFEESMDPTNCFYLKGTGTVTVVAS